MTNVKDPEFVWKLIQECGEEERHFNTLQSVYRGLASTWLLAMFAGIGFLLNLTSVSLWCKHLLIALSGAATTVGVFLLWLLDYHYHRLLLAYFDEGRRLEGEFSWLPQVRRTMRGDGRVEFFERHPWLLRLRQLSMGKLASPRFNSLRECVTWFYAGVAFVSVVVCAFELARVSFLLWQHYSVALLVAVVTLAAYFVVTGVAFRTVSHKGNQKHFPPGDRPKAA